MRLFSCQAYTVQRISIAAPQGLLSDQDISSECGGERRDLCEHTKKRLETGLGHKAYFAHGQMSTHCAERRVGTQRRSGQTVARELRRVFFTRQIVH